MPKPMLPVANKPLMEHIIELLKKHGITDVVATVQFLSSVIRNYFGDGSDLGIGLVLFDRGGSHGNGRIRSLRPGPAVGNLHRYLR